jgi:hypothetical protein
MVTSLFQPAGIRDNEQIALHLVLMHLNQGGRVDMQADGWFVSLICDLVHMP